MLPHLRFALFTCATTLLPSHAAIASAQQECEEWARSDNVSAMLWDRYVDSCVASMQGEEVEESTGIEDEPASAPTKPDNSKQEVDQAY